MKDQNNSQYLLIQQKQQQYKFDGLNKIHIMSYGVGHFINDLCSTCWFNYLLFYLNKIVCTNSAFVALLAGQIADAIATPLIGFLSDRTKTRFGQRKPWYVFGFILVILGFLPTWQNILNYNQNIAAKWQYFVQCGMGFPSGQSYVAGNIFELFQEEKGTKINQDLLNNLRNTFTFISNFLVLIFAFLMFKFLQHNNFQFEYLSYIVIGIGSITSIMFIAMINQVQLSLVSHFCATNLKKKLLKIDCSTFLLMNHSFQKNFAVQQQQSDFELSQDQRDNHKIIKKSTTVTFILQRSMANNIMKWSDWFSKTNFYLFGLSYMGIRMYTNLLGTFLPFFLINVLQLSTNQQVLNNNISINFALIPLTIYFFSVIISLLQSKIYMIIGRKKTMLLGTFLGICYSLVLLFINKQTIYLIYPVAIVIGISQSMVLSTGINLISEVVGVNAKKGAFVFGAYNFLDKLACGLVIFFIAGSEKFKNEKEWTRSLTILVTTVPCIIATLIVMFSDVKEYIKRKQQQKSLSDQLVT